MMSMTWLSFAAWQPAAASRHRTAKLNLNERMHESIEQIDKKDIVLLSFCLVGAAVEGQTKEVFTPEHVARIRQVSSCKLSPDGRHIAYVLQVPRELFEDDDGPERAELHVVDVDGQSRPYITGAINVGAMDWTPDGSGISFLAKRGEDEHKALYLIPIGQGGIHHRSRPPGPAALASPRRDRTHSDTSRVSTPLTAGR